MVVQHSDNIAVVVGIYRHKKVPNVCNNALMLVHCLRQWFNTKPALGECLAIAGVVDVKSGQKKRYIPLTGLIGVNWCK